MAPFHASGFYGSLFFPLFTGTTVILPPAAIPPSASIAADALDVIQEKVDIILMPPPYMEDLGSNPFLLSRISSKIKSATSPSLSAGNAIAAKMQLFDDLGSTEMGLWPIVKREGGWNGRGMDEYWHYIIFHPAMNVRLGPVSESPDGESFEGVIVKNREDGLMQPIFKVFPELKEYHTSDLFTRHPQDPELWRHYGRADDLLVFITGEKFHPEAAERRIASRPSVEEVMMARTRRPRAALIVRLAEDGKLEDIWKTIEDVNKALPVYAGVERELGLVVKEPFLKTAKGTVQRKAMGALYEKELDRLFEKIA